MCTVTVVPYLNIGCPHGGRCIRVACNRDEQRGRPAALLPQVGIFGEREAVFPIDPTSRGTWLAINDAGLCFALLNVNDGPQRTMPSLSRGTIIPSLLHCGTMTTALARVSSLDASHYAPFRLLVLDRLALAEVHSDTERTHLVQCSRITSPLLFTSSGLGDALAEQPRRRLFESSFRQREDWLGEQHAFHRHRWPACPELSVNMSRADARTVSYSLANLTPEKSTFSYYPDAPDQPAEPSSIVLHERIRGAA